ncbi:MAG: hypothetical protein Q7T82_07015 [Armatimonadota bacterium]|nr:hypothetical protein [Armatimonadota bacterium]
MNRNRALMLLVIVAVAAGVYYQISLNQETGSAEQQIAAVIQRAESGVERGDARMAMSVVSRDYKDDMGTTYSLLRIRATDALNSNAQPDVTLANSRFSITGDHGTLQTHVRVGDRRTEETLFDHDLTIHLRKEKLRKYLIFRTREWRVVSVQGLESVLD